MERLVLSDAELHDGVVRPGQCRSFGVQLVQQWLKFILTWERSKMTYRSRLSFSPNGSPVL